MQAAAPIGKWALLKGLSAAGQLISSSDEKKKKQRNNSE